MIAADPLVDAPSDPGLDPQLLGDLPRWKQIELALLAEIDSGAIKVGDRLPGENTLAPHFGVTRTTLRRALLALQHKGVLRVEKGRGAFVASRLMRYSLAARSSFKANLRDQSLVPGSRILRKFEIAAPGDVARALRLGDDAAVVVLDTIGEASGVVVAITRHHLPARLFPDAAARVTAFACITEVYRAFGFRATRRAACEIAARLPSDEEAHHLAQPRNEPILEVRSLKTTARGQPIDYTVARFCAARVSVTFAP
jgi:GntR family phosphonate transport system transcriptional regulator